jgi:rhamnogalacturonyl hydrolase YesR
MTVSAPSVRACTETLRDYVESADYAGYDPYDALNSPLIRLVGGTSKWVRLAATQAMRRCPVNVRPLLGVRKGHNPKAVGLFLWGYAKLFAIERKRAYLDRIDHLLGLLEQLKSAGYSGSCWGYNFDWQSRSVLRPKWTPTIVNTAFIGHALLDCFEVTGSQRALDLATTIPDFILNDLNRTSSDGTFCFSYSPLDN